MKLNIIVIIFSLVFLHIVFSQLKINYLLDDAIIFFSNIEEFFYKNLRLEKFVGKFLEMFDKPFKTLITIILLILAMLLFSFFLKNLFLALISIIILSIVIYLLLFL